MAKRIDSIQVTSPKMFQHDLSHQHVTTLDYFRLQPICIMDMVQKDSFNVNLSSIIEASPLATKVYGRANVDYHAFFVPCRILWKDYNNYRYGNQRSTDNEFVLPHFTLSRLNTAVSGSTVTADGEVGKFVPASLDDSSKVEARKILGSLGYPTFAIVNDSSARAIGATDNGALPLSALPARSLVRIWWDWFRDSVNIEEKNKSAYLYDSGGVITDAEMSVLTTPRYRCWQKDYITTLLPSPQMGDASVATADYALGEQYSDNDNRYVVSSPGGIGVTTGVQDSATKYKNKLLTHVSAMAMRGAIALQRYLEKLNVTGTRPMERIQALFGGNLDAVRLDMSEFIGSYRQPLNISGLTNTGSADYLANSDSDNVWGIDSSSSSFGTQKGRAYSEGNSPSFSYTAKEDGYFIVVASILPEVINPSAINRLFYRGLATPDSSNTDFYTPEFDGIGYQETLQNECALPEYTQFTEGTWGFDYDPYRVIGYQPKYEDYRYIQDRISGDFQEPSSSTALRNMVFVRNLQDGYFSGEFPTREELTTANHNDRANLDNHFQITDSDKDHFVLNCYFKVNASRPITKTELPTALADMANSNLLSVANGGVRL